MSGLAGRWLVLLLMVATFGTPGAAALPAESWSEEPYYWELRLGRRLLVEGLAGLLRDGTALVPFGELMAALEVPITVDASAGRAEGWFVDEARRFELDLGRLEVRIEGRTEPLDPAWVERWAGDLYVDAARLSEWLPIDVRVDLVDLVIEIESREKLPIELALERAERWDRLAGRPIDGPLSPAQKEPYHLIDWPVVDLLLGANLSRNDGEWSRRNNHSFLARGDLLGTTGSLFVNGSGSDVRTDPIAGARLRLGRRDGGGRLLWGLGATEFELGDLFSPSDELISLSQPGLGFQVSSFPLDRPRSADDVDLRGLALPGWDVELYQNDVLIDVRTTGRDGLYEFLDVPLVFGDNLFRLVIYGPQGQRREEVRRVHVGSGLPPVGESHYRIGVYQQGEGLLKDGTLLSFAHDQEDGAPRLTPEERSALLAGETRWLVEVERGLGRQVAVGSRLISLVLPDGRHHYAHADLRTATRRLSANLELATDTRGGWAGMAELATRLRGLSLFFEHTRIAGLVSEQISPTDPLEAASDLRINGSFGVAGSTLPFQVAVRYEERAAGDRLRLDQRLGARLGGLNVSNQLSWQLSDNTSFASGSLLLSRRTRRVPLRGNLSYVLAPRLELTSIDLTADLEVSPRLRLVTGLSHSLSDFGGTQGSIGANWERRALLLGFSLALTDTGDIQTGVTLSFSLGRSPRSGRWLLRREPRAQLASLSARVFLDRNQNGVFDGRDEPLPGVELEVDGLPRRPATDAAGLAWLDLPPDRRSDVALREGSLENPFWTASGQGTGIVPRRGRTWGIDFPVVETGEIDGMVFLGRTAPRAELSNVRLQLIDAEGQPVREVRSQFDGFYLFERVPPGRYRLQVDPDQLERLGLQAEPLELVVGSGEILSAREVVLEMLAE